MANDVGILASILGVLLVAALVLPWVYQMVGDTSSSYSNPELNMSRMEGGMDTGSMDSFSSGWDIIGGLWNSFFWTWTWLPGWLITLHVLLRVIGVFIVVRLVRGTG